MSGRNAQDLPRSSFDGLRMSVASGKLEAGLEGRRHRPIGGQAVTIGPLKM